MSNNKKKSKLKPVPVLIVGLTVVALAVTIGTVAYKSNKDVPDNSASVSVVSEKKLKDTQVNIDTTKVATTVEIQLKDSAITVGTILKVAAIVTPANTESALVWSSSDENVFTVDKDGVVTVKGKGTAALTATIGTVSDSVIIEGIENIASGSERGLSVYTGDGYSSGSVPVQESNNSNNVAYDNGIEWDENEDADVDAGSENGDFQEGNQEADNIPAATEKSNEKSNGLTSSSVAGSLPGLGFQQRMSNVYVYEKNDVYYGEVIIQPNLAIVYVKQRSTDFDSMIQNVLKLLLPEQYSQVWNNFVSAGSDKTFMAEGRRVRIVTALNGGHSQIVIYN